MCMEITFLRISSRRFLVFFREETWKEKGVSEAFNAIQVQILNKPAVSQKSYILGGKKKQLVSKHQLCEDGKKIRNQKHYGLTQG